jgi:hypothetical protein
LWISIDLCREASCRNGKHLNEGWMHKLNPIVEYWRVHWKIPHIKFTVLSRLLRAAVITRAVKIVMSVHLFEYLFPFLSLFFNDISCFRRKNGSSEMAFIETIEILDLVEVFASPNRQRKEFLWMFSNFPF